MGILYFLILAINIVGRAMQSPIIDYISKPLLMPLLMPLLIFIFWKFCGQRFNKSQKFTALALLFSWFGDLFLMFHSKGELFFIGGLSAFLIAHLLFVYAFFLSNNGKTGALKKSPVFFIPLIIFQIMFLFLSWPGLADLKTAVIFYSCAISGMTLFAINRMGAVSSGSFFTVLFGALLFLVSDSIIGLNKFVFAIPYAGAIIMLFYGSGQYLISKGMSQQ